MSDKFYFKLYTHRSYQIRGNSGKMYYFKRDIPVEVDNASDANKFRAQHETLKECDKDGNPVFMAREQYNRKSRAYKTYKKDELPKDPEELLRQLTEDGHRPNKIDLNALMRQVNEDLGHKDGSIMVDDVNKPLETQAKDAEGNELKNEKEYDNEGDSKDSKGSGEEKVSTASAEDDSDEDGKAKKKPKAKAKKQNECPKCGRTFQSKEKLEEHLEDHELEG